MFRRYSAALLSLVLVVSVAVSSQAQSGRGRQLRIHGALRSESVSPQATESPADEKTDGGISAGPAVLSRRTKGWVYNDAAANQKKDEGDYHMTRADKRAGWILLGVFLFWGAIIVSDD